MVSNDSGHWFAGLCREFPDRLGWLMGPTWWKNPRRDISFALDNDAFQSYHNGTPYDYAAWGKFLKRVSETGLEPLWAAVPDVVADRQKTLEQWAMFNCVVSGDFGWQTALVVQDGMTMIDVERCQPDVVFVGGTTEWKWQTAHVWCQNFPRVHIGRVRSRRLSYCEQIGAESCDGSGWFRESYRGRPARQLEGWLHNPRPQPEFHFVKRFAETCVS